MTDDRVQLPPIDKDSVCSYYPSKENNKSVCYSTLSDKILPHNLVDMINNLLPIYYKKVQRKFFTTAIGLLEKYGRVFEPDSKQ